MFKKFSLVIMIVMCTLIVKAQSRMTPELLWDLKRVSNVQVSPDNTQVLFSVKEYDLQANKGSNDLYVVSVDGGDIKKITNFEGSKYDAQWRPDGKKIGFLRNEKRITNIYEINPDGSDLLKVSRMKYGVGGFKYSPDGSKILFIRDVKLNKFHSTELELDLSQSNAKVYDNLMYRHWSSYEDGEYSHVFFAVIQNGLVQGQGVDIMAGEAFDAPMKPFGGMEQITFSPDGNSIIYTCKKMSGKEYAFSTNSALYHYD